MKARPEGSVANPPRGSAESIRHDENKQRPVRTDRGCRSRLRHKSEAKARRIARESYGPGIGFVRLLRSGIRLSLEARHDADTDPDFCLRPRAYPPGGGLGRSRRQRAKLRENAQRNRFDPDPAWHCPCLSTLVRALDPNR